MSKVWKSGLSYELKRRLFVATVESVLTYGCKCWSLTSTLEQPLDGSYTWMLHAAFNINWQSHITNDSLYDMQPRVLDKVTWRRLGLAGHCYRQGNLAGKLILWEPRHGQRSRGRSLSTFIDTLKRDVGAECTNELSVCMKN